MGTELSSWLGVIGAVVSFLMAIIGALLAFTGKFVLNSYESRIKILESKSETFTVHQAQAVAQDANDRQTLTRLEHTVSDFRDIVNELKVELAQFKRSKTPAYHMQKVDPR